MKALVYHGPGEITWEERPRPVLGEASDVIVEISKTTLCGTDLAILKGGVSTVKPGRILGHEATARIVEVGPAVSDFAVGDHVIVPCTTSCGRCPACRKGLFSSCDRGGWQIGNTRDGVQAEFACIPCADSSLHKIPKGMDEEAALMLADILPTGLEVGVQKADVGLGDVVVVIGAGPVGLATIVAAQFYGPSQIVAVDRDAHRLEAALRLGATIAIDNTDGSAEKQILEITGGRGADVVIEAIGSTPTFELAQRIIGAGGRMANVGIFSKSTEIHNHVLWTRNISLKMGVVNTNSIPVLLRMIEAGRLDPRGLISHRFALDEILHAYDLFKNAAREQALKIVLDAGKSPVSAIGEEEKQIQFIVGRVLASLKGEAA
ncbi:MAG: alcohol dehydrogenase catalytic domain-containing protein [Phyllobacteriaceae bacterium]|nr:alcohol dehydrogenase catalytic domain-containing protein [Phyllobacteriaceae bacterium]